jgi:hypothetical protein
MEMMFRIISPIVIFALLYTIAFISNIHYRDKEEDVLFVSKSQWEGIFLLMLPTLIAVFMR